MVAWKTSPNTIDLHTVLIISQDAEMVDVWKTLLEQRNCRVTVESAAENAAQTARLFVPALIILELPIPEAELIALCKELRAVTSGTLLVFAPRESNREFAGYHSAGADEVLPAPVSPMALLIKSMAWLARQEWLVPRKINNAAYA